MTIWKAIANLIQKLADWIPTPCKHEWKDNTAVNTFSEYSTGPRARPIAQHMIQRCEKCHQFRRLKVF